MVVLAITQQTRAQAPISDFVQVDGDKFMYHGQQFFPIMVNYTGLIADGPNGLQVCCDGFDPWEVCTYGDWVASFQELRSKGFNSIRLLGMNVGVHCTSFLANSSGCNECTESTTLQYQRWPGNVPEDWTRYVDVGPAPYTDYFAMLDLILDAAEEADIKVMLLTGKQAISDNIIPAFNNWLVEVTEHCKNKPALFAYDLQNEPAYNDDDCHHKGRVCEIVRDWTDIVHAHCPQLTTTCVSPWEFWWDPGVMHIDFLSPHVYAPEMVNQTPLDYDRVFRDLYWFRLADLGMPWMIGEIGFSADIDDGNVTGDHGQISDMLTFIQTTLDFVRDCGGDGYAWWALGDEFGNTSLSAYWGLKTLGGVWKPVTAPFENFSLSGASPPFAPLTYYNKFVTVQSYEIHGQVLSAPFVPVYNACVIAGYTNGSVTTTTETFTDINGNYTLYCPVPIFDLKASAPAHSVWSSSLTYANHSTVTIPLQATFNAPQSLTLGMVSIPLNGYQNYRAFDNIETSGIFNINGNGTTGGQCDMHAQQFIKLHSGFLAERGSVFHAWIGPVGPTCDEVFAVPLANRMENPELGDSSVANSGSYKVFPNPFSGLITIEKTSDEATSVEVLNAVGQTVVNSVSFSAKSTTIDLSDQAMGVYFVKITTGDQTEIVRVVKMN